MNYRNALNDDILNDIKKDLKESQNDNLTIEDWRDDANGITKVYGTNFIGCDDAIEAINGFKSASDYDGMIGILDMLYENGTGIIQDENVTLDDREFDHMRKFSLTNPSFVACQAYNRRFDEFMDELLDTTGLADDDKLTKDNVAALIKAANETSYSDLDY